MITREGAVAALNRARRVPPNRELQCWSWFGLAPVQGREASLVRANRDGRWLR